jgi:hypothetical protein
MKQTPLASLVDTVAGTAVAFVVALGVQWAVAAWFDLPLRMSDNAAIVVVFTAVSLVRGYAWRRLMEAFRVQRPLSPFMQAAIAERFRQIEVKGYSAQNDNALEPGELARAGAAYAIAADGMYFGNLPLCDAAHPATQVWPWSSDPMRLHNGYRDNLARATALLIAEGERHDRNRKKRAA